MKYQSNLSDKFTKILNNNALLLKLLLGLIMISIKRIIYKIKKNYWNVSVLIKKLRYFKYSQYYNIVINVIMVKQKEVY